MTPKRKRNALSAVLAQSVQETVTYSDAGGLDLRAKYSGTEYWFQRVTIDGKRRHLGLCEYPMVSLAEARQAALVNARMIREGATRRRRNARPLQLASDHPRRCLLKTFSLSPGRAHDAPEGRKLLTRLGPQRLGPFLLMDHAYEGNETRQLAPWGTCRWLHP